MTARLHGPAWRVKRLNERASTLVFLVEHRDGAWFGVVERHENCHGIDPHDACRVLQRIVSTPLESKDEAESALRQLSAELRAIKR